MGSLFSSNQEQGVEDDRSLQTLLQEDDVPWNLVQARLSRCPEEAALFCHSVEPSPLMLALQKSDNHVPVAVYDAFVDAYEDAVYALDGDGQNVLHVCHEARIANKILRRIPNAPRQTSNSGKLPLHCVREKETTTILLQSYGEGVACRDKRGNLPIHYAVENATVGAIQVLLSSHSNVLARSKSGVTALSVMCKRFEESYTQPVTPETQELWKLIVFAIHSVREEQPLLHSVIELRCPQAVVSHALSTCPGQTRVRNADGRTPLLLASLIASPEIIQLLALADQEAGRMVDKEGRLPIDVAAENGLDSEQAMAALVRAEPRAVDTRDLRDGMFPFLTAAIGNDANLDTIYQLLKTKPHVLMYSDVLSSLHEKKHSLVHDDDDTSENSDEDNDPSKDSDYDEDGPSPNKDKDAASMLDPPKPVLLSDHGIQNNIGGHRALTISESDGALTDGLAEEASFMESVVSTSPSDAANMLIDVE